MFCRLILVVVGSRAALLVVERMKGEKVTLANGGLAVNTKRLQGTGVLYAPRKVIEHMCSEDMSAVHS